MDWNDIVTIFNLLDSKVLFGGFLLWRWWRGRERGPVVHPEQPVQLGDGVEAVTTTNAEVGTTWTQ